MANAPPPALQENTPMAAYMKPARQGSKHYVSPLVSATQAPSATLAIWPPLRKQQMEAQHKQ
jgi:hypothetical protein